MGGYTLAANTRLLLWTLLVYFILISALSYSQNLILSDQDIHTELIQYRRAQMIKQGLVKEELSVDSYARKGNGSCPLMPEEVLLSRVS